MTRRSEPCPHSFTARERELIRREMGQHFGQFLRLADGIVLRSWCTGTRKGEPKISPAVASMQSRGLVEIPRGVRAGRSPCSPNRSC
jgi:hypothetical protein